MHRAALLPSPSFRPRDPAASFAPRFSIQASGVRTFSTEREPPKDGFHDDDEIGWIGSETRAPYVEVDLGDAFVERGRAAGEQGWVGGTTWPQSAREGEGGLVSPPITPTQAESGIEELHDRELCCYLSCRMLRET